MYILRTDLMSSIQESFKTFMYSVCSFIYELIIYLYDFFDLLCHGRIMDDSLVQQISFRISLILGLVMFFRVIFSFIQYLINPDTISDKEKGALNLVKKVLIVIVLLGTTSYLFDFAYKVQNLLLGDNDGNVNVISRLLLPETVDSENFGGVFSANLFLSFYTMNDSLIPEESRSSDEYVKCLNYRTFLQNEIVKYNEFYLGYNCLSADSVITVPSKTSGADEVVDLINFNYFLAIAVGIFVCWALLMYCFSVGVRIIQLAFLEIIAPMAIISYLGPSKDGMFQKWLKMCSTTYLDVFIRVAIINFVVLMIANIVNGIGTASGVFWESLVAYKGSIVVNDSLFFLQVVIILALLQFAVKAPELLKELLPKSMAASGDFGFGLKNRSILGKAMAVTGGVAAGSAIGLVSGVAGGKGWSKFTGAIGGILGGVGRGITTGISSKGASLGDITKTTGDVRKKQADVGLKRAQRIASGTRFGERVGDATRGFFGIQEGYSQVDSTLSVFNNLNSLIGSEDIVKDYEAQRAKANEDLGRVQREYDAGLVNIDALNAAKEAYSKADGRVSAVKEAVYKAARTGSAVTTFDDVKWIDRNGVEQHIRGESIISEVGSNASITASIKNIETVSGRQFNTRKAFNDERKRLQAVSNTKHKNGK